MSTRVWVLVAFTLGAVSVTIDQLLFALVLAVQLMALGWVMFRTPEAADSKELVTLPPTHSMDIYVPDEASAEDNAFWDWYCGKAR